MFHVSPDVTIGFEQEVYTVREDAGSLPVCAVLLEGSRELEREVEVIIRLLSETTATGQLNNSYIINILSAISLVLYALHSDILKVVFLSVTPLDGVDFTFTQKLTFNASTERQIRGAVQKAFRGERRDQQLRDHFYFLQSSTIQSTQQD